VCFQAEDLRRFAKESGDVNPLHMDEAYARKSAFGRRVVFGALGALVCLERLPIRSGLWLTHVVVEFRHPIFLDLEYTVHLAPPADGVVEAETRVELRDGNLVLLRLIAGFGEGERPSPGLEGQSKEAFPQRAEPRRIPQVLSDAALLAEPMAEGTHQARAEAGRFPACELALRLASYLIGMELPGRRALFSRATLRFPKGAPVAVDDIVRYRLTTRSFEDTFGALALDLRVWSENGPVVEGELAAFARKEIPAAAYVIPGGRDLLDDRLAGKVALVTGGSRGLGAAFVRTLAQRGCHVALNYRSSQEEAEALAVSLKDAPGKVLLLGGDAGDRAWCEEARAQVLRRFGKLDLLISNACAPPVTLGTSASSKAAARRYIDENYALAMTPIEVFLPDVAAQGGAVVALSSIILEAEGAEWPQYRRLKTAVEAFVQSTAAREDGVSFLLVRPPALLTEMSNTPARAAQALDPALVAGRVVDALAQPELGPVRILNDFTAPVVDMVPDDTIMVAASFTHDGLRLSVEHWLQTLGHPAALQLTPYAQMFRDMLDPAGLLVANPQGLNVLLIRVEDWLRNATEDPEEGPDRTVPPSARERALLRDSLSAFLEALEAYAKRGRCVTALILCPASSAEGQHPEWGALLSKAEEDLREGAANAVADLIVLVAEDYHRAYGVAEDIHDPVRDALGHIPYSAAYFNVLGTLVTRCYAHARCMPYKVLVLDCDNTLWGGVCGEVGPKGVQVDGPYRAFQSLLVEQSKRGMLLCLCSKNQEEDVWAVFDANPDMPLRREHIVDGRINWERKSENLRSLAEALNLGLDSFAFFDDSPVECAEVRAARPEVTTIQWPTDASGITRYLAHLWVFDRFLATDEDAKRSNRYRSQVERGRLLDQSSDFATFLRDLNLTIDVAPLAEADLPRAAQLTQRTNQFNFSTRRKTLGDVRQWLGEPGQEGWSVRVCDRFGDYGLVGLLLLRETGGDALEVDTFLLSCRVLGRGVEHRMLAHVGGMARDRGLASVRIGFAVTAKNKPARMFLDGVLPAAMGRSEDSFELECPADTVAAIAFSVTEDRGPVEDEAAGGAVSLAPVDPTSTRAREAQLTAIAGASDLAELARAIGTGATAKTSPAPTVAAVATSSSKGSGQTVPSALKTLFASALSMAPEALDPDRPLEGYGVDSMKIVEITVALKGLHPDLPVTFLFEHKTLSGVAESLARMYPDSAPPPPPPSVSPKVEAWPGPALPKGEPEERPEDGDRIAIIGMNGRFPGAPDLPTFWENLKAGHCAIDDIPANRWEVDVFHDPKGGEGKSYTRVGGFLKDVDRFDAGFFRVSPREAELMDPQQRLMLESVWGLLEDAGYTRETVDRDTGVFIGALSNDYAAYANTAALVSGGAYRNADFYQIPNRVSYFYDLRGPSLMIDSACSASGTALHFACQSLRDGVCGMAVVGGINLFLHPSRFVQYSQMRMISPSGKCSPFGAEADGTLFGEGLGTVLLKPLARARADGDNIHGVILSTAVNSGGRSNGFTVPDPRAQADLIARAIRDAGIGSETIGYVEAHGTGTPLGDPIEARGLAMAFSETASDMKAGGAPSVCALGTVKANIGHLESAAAMSGLIKTLLQMKHRTLAPTLHAETLNPNIPFASTPFRPQQGAAPWEPAIPQGATTAPPRRAGISSFGAGGSNAHIIVEEFSSDRSPVASAVRLFPFSAHREGALVKLVRRFVTLLRSEAGAELDLADIAFTLGAGREVLRERLAVVTEGREALTEALEEWLSDPERTGGRDWVRGSLPQDRDAAPERRALKAAVSDRGALMELARFWVVGGEVDWSVSQGVGSGEGRAPRRVSLPLYPFGGASHWLAGAPNLSLSRLLSLSSPSTTGPSQPPSVAEPESSVTRRLFGLDDPVIRDHRVRGQAILPGVAYLQEALVAAGLADGRPCRLEHVVWSHPFALEAGAKTLEIRLEARDGGGEEATAFTMRTEGVAEGRPHAQGSLRPVAVGTLQAPERIDPERILARCPTVLDKPTVYRRFAEMEIDYGPRFQGVERMAFNDREALGFLALPPGREGETADILLHPTLLDGALQTALLFAAEPGAPFLPFSLDSLEVFGRMKGRCLAHVIRNGAGGLDIAVTGADGTACMTLTNLVLREKIGPLDGLLHLPQWEVRGPALEAQETRTADLGVLVIGGAAFPDLREAIAASHSGGRLLERPNGLEPDTGELEQVLANFGSVDRLYVLGGLVREPLALDDLEGLSRVEEQGVLSFFRLLKVLHARGLSRTPVEIRILTNGAHALTGEEPVTPQAAALIGLAKVAAKEFPRLDIASVDLGRKDVERCQTAEDWARLLRLVQAEPGNRGEEVLIRGGLRYARTLHPLRLPASGPEPFREGVTCLVLGGAGGLGFAFSEHLARSRKAKLVWLGRRAEDDAIRAKIARIRELGGDALYLQAEVTDPEAVAAAVASAKACFGPIQGAVHSAIVLEDKTLANMEEAAFRRALDPKSRGTVSLYRALRDEPLDFFLFFSSINSFQASMGQANYVAGCHFKDAFARALQAQTEAHRGDLASGPKVRVINWGFWGSVGVVASEDYRARLSAEGHGSIEPAEGMAVIERVLRQTPPQVVALKADAARLREIGVNTASRAVLLGGDGCAIPGGLPRTLPAPRVAADRMGRFQEAFEELEVLGCRMLLHRVQDMGALNRVGERWTKGDLRDHLAIVPAYFDLFEAFLDLLAGRGAIAITGEVVVALAPVADPAFQAADGAALERGCARLGETWPELRERLPLLLACFRAWPEVLTGRRAHMDVLFPKGELTLVEGIYKGNEITAAYNDALAELVRDTVEARLARDPAATVSILEVGAGTGGTSGPVLAALDAFGDRVRYVYSDVSRKFLQEGEAKFGQDRPHLSFHPFDLDKPPADQGFEAGAFDLVIGTNCVHATRSILATLGFLKAVLKRNGLLLLNEFTERLDYNTLTFGLTTGWWLFQDPEFRIKGSPLLDREGWRLALESLGFGAPRFAAPALPNRREPGQHLIVCESDGHCVTRASVQPKSAHPTSVQPNPDLAVPPVAPTSDASTAAGETKTASTGGMEKGTRLYVKGVFSDVLKMPLADVEDHLTFDHFGVDSLLAMSILDRFERDFGGLSPTLLFEQITVTDLAAYFIETQGARLAELVHPEPVSEAAPPARPAEGGSPATVSAPKKPLPVPMPERGSSEVAIIGLSGRYPEADTLERFWDNLARGRNCLTEVPADRWDWRSEGGGPEAKGGRWGGFLTDVDKFDSLFFNISPRDAERMAPEARLFLETVWQALEQAGYTPKRFRALSQGPGRDIGVFVGCMYQQYPLRTRDAELRGVLSGTSYWSIANRVSHFLDLHGPSMAVDTACSSALSAIHMACESIRHGDCAAAIAGGVNLTLDPGKYANLRDAGMLGSTPESRSLGDGDGLIPSEGVGAVLLKPLDRALADGDRIQGIIKASLVNNDGRTGGFTVPNPNAQADLVTAALDRAGIHPETIGYVEMAANGSALGDPVEVTGLTKAFRRRTDRVGFCAVGSVKSNLGHPEAVSGMAQLTKVLLQFRHRTLAPTLNADPLNPKLRLEDTPFRPQRTLAPWEPPAADMWLENGPPRRRAAINSFGAGGTNAHLIVEEYLAPSISAAMPGDQSSGEQVIVLSARTEEQLLERARQMLAVLREVDGDRPALADLAYTLQVGREPMRARLAFVARDLEGLENTLTITCATWDEASGTEARGGEGAVFRSDLVAGRSPMPLLLDGEEGRAYLANVIAGRKLAKIAQLWAMGLEIDWALLTPERETTGAPRLCALPGYPFARIRHWLSDGRLADGEGASEAPASKPRPQPARVVAPVVQPKPAPASMPVGRSPQAVLREHLKTFIADILKLSEAEIDFDIELREYGFDSINLTELTKRVNERFGLDLTVDLFFGHPTIERCARFLWEEYGSRITGVDCGIAPPAEPLSPVVEAAVPVSNPVETWKPVAPAIRELLQPADRAVEREGGAIAIIGMGATMPGAEDLSSFWENLVAGRDLIADMSEDRLHRMGVSRADLLERLDIPVLRGGFLNRIDAFDSLFFGISPREAQLMDPQQRLLLEVAWQTIEDAGYPPSELAGGRVGVFVGVGNHDYAKLYQRVHGQPLAHASTGMMIQSILANRVSYLFDFHGPSEIVDTACSSSTVALHRAAQAIRAGECAVALVAGVNVVLDWHGYAVLQSAGILSQDGRVRLFDPDGTGYVRGEGVGAVLLKSLAQAIADRDHIHGVIRGSATNFDGKTYSMTAPNPLAQTQVVCDAFRAAGLSPTEIDHIEAQGTGSPLGDPVEINAFKGAFRNLLADWGQTLGEEPQWGVGYLKPRIGHLESASGMAGLIKILLAMKHGVMPGSFSKQENAPAAASPTNAPVGPFQVTRQSQPWTTTGGRPRRAGLHSFGFGGVNAHVVLEEHGQDHGA
jgi:FkbH-like protein